MRRRLLRALVTGALALCVGLVLVGGGAGARGQGTRTVLYGLNDDAWLLVGPGTLESRLSELDRLGADVFRLTLRWDHVAQTRPRSPRDPDDPAYDWSEVDAALRGLRRHGTDPVVTLFGTPGWANGGRAQNWAPTSGGTFASFAYAAATRYPWVRYWTIWNEPNRTTFLRPTTAKTYVEKLLNPGYVQLHAANARVRVGGGVTAPRGGSSGVSPVAWIHGMADAKAKLDAYAHHPYPGRPQSETPWAPACGCTSLTMADLDRLEIEVRRAFGDVRIWLTEYGYQTNPPDTFLGVPPETQAKYVAGAALRVYRSSSVDMLVYYMVRDDSAPEGWQSGLFTAGGVEKPAYAAFRMPLVQTSRRGRTVGIWGQVRPRSGSQPYRIRIEDDERSSWLGGVRWTDSGGFFSISVEAPAGARLRIWSPRDDAYGYEMIVR